jgi:hypothetical protein
MSDPNCKLALRVHDECNGSDVFGSDICTCRPYLLFGIEEAVKEAQAGGSGVVIYFRKEGRALGEVTKVYIVDTIITTAELTQTVSGLQCPYANFFENGRINLMEILINWQENVVSTEQASTLRGQRYEFSTMYG